MNQFEEIRRKVHKSERISEADALYLFEKTDLLQLGQLANQRNQMVNGKDVYFNINRHINPTNVCVKSCKFCAFSRKPGDEGAYEYTIEEVVERASQAVANGATEVHMVGGLHPRWNFNHYLEMIGAVKQKFPDLHVKAFTAVEIDWLAAKARLSVADTLEKLRSAGLNSLPGGGAEIFHPEIRSKICDTKTTADDWLQIHRTAHSIGLRSNCTMLYGHIENYTHRVDHMSRLRQLQDETEGFNVFIPLAFQPHDNNMGITRYTAGADDLRTIAVARLFLDNFRNIKSYWVMLGQDIAQLALNFGANDIDGTVTEEKISRMAGGRAGMVMSRSQILSVIRRSGRLPVERDTLYKAIWRDALDVRATDAGDPNLLLFKWDKGELLTKAELLLLAQQGELLDMAQAISSHFNRTADGVPAATSISVPDSYDELMQQLNIFGAKGGKVQLTGLKKLWQHSAAAQVEFIDTARKLRQLGVVSVESCLTETEIDMTVSELVGIHEVLHNAGIATVAKLELDGSFATDVGPFWERFVDRLLGLVTLQQRTGKLLGVTIEPGRDSVLTAAEFLRGIALARLVFPAAVPIRVPFEKIPTMKVRPNISDSNHLTDPVFKLLGLVPLLSAHSVVHNVDLQESIRSESLRVM